MDFLLYSKEVLNTFRSNLLKKFACLCEGTAMQRNPTLLNEIYTELYITESESGEISNEHEVRQIETRSRRPATVDTAIKCSDIFRALPGQDKAIRTVLTKGVAGIGKTVCVQKLILDWAEGKENQDVQLIFPLPFREINLMKDTTLSLSDLLHVFFPETKEMEISSDEYKVLFIFDGLDECRLSLNFKSKVKLCNISESASVNELLMNLIVGNLLASALIWITSRPAAANQIPSKYIHRLTEIQGFTEPQKEEYFRKRISDEHQASRIISHIRGARSLHIMCHIPVFCWISSIVFEKLLKEDLSAEIPQTLTEMFIHFLLNQIKMTSQKYEERDPEKLLQSNREVIVKLAEVAFKQLMKGNVMFYEEDLIESRMDVTDASVYSGICTEIFKQESVIHQRKVYSFIHLSIQEFLAAFYLLYCCLTKNQEPLHEFRSYTFDEISLYDVLTSAVDKALKSKNGHLDLFLRFLLGVSLESNQRLLQDLLTHTENSSETIRETTQYIKEKIKDTNDHYSLSADQSINLFLCLLEVKDQTLFREIQEFVKSDKHSKMYISAGHCSTISYMLQMSEEPLDELNLKKYSTTAEGIRRLIPAVINCRKALFSDCELSEQDCEIVSSALQSSNCVLRELHLSNNLLQDSGVKFISDGLKSPNCQLQILSLAVCNLTSQCCESLSSALQSSNCVLRELDLRNNDLQDSGVKFISDGLKSPNCQLQILSLAVCNLTAQCCESLSSALQSSNCVLRELDLSNNDLQDSGVKFISDGLKSPNCQLQILSLAGCNLTAQCCERLSSALQSSNCVLRELDLSNNDLQDSGVKFISDGLKSPNCQLQILSLAGCNLTAQCCERLSTALISLDPHRNPLAPKLLLPHQVTPPSAHTFKMPMTSLAPPERHSSHSPASSFVSATQTIPPKSRHFGAETSTDKCTRTVFPVNEQSTALLLYV
uniref:NACHT domain-containing protein n=1 Tax=Cyprinus carpio TaxID=7962 RepID=A0A8C2FXC7_CYPCA